MMKPIIGITADLAENGEKKRYASDPWYALRKNYCDAVSDAGGVAIILPYQPESIEAISSIVHGVIIPGGADVDPRYYAQKCHDKTVPVHALRDEFESVILAKALERKIPVLAICRGMQLLNVVRGGSLIQDIPEHPHDDKATINHMQPMLRDEVVHKITILPNTKLIGIANGSTFMVNSSHHQAIDELGDGLVVSARAPDGIIEGIESSDKNFVIGVQWHPEYICENGIDKNLFTSLIEVARNYSRDHI